MKIRPRILILCSTILVLLVILINTNRRPQSDERRNTVYGDRAKIAQAMEDVAVELPPATVAETVAPVETPLAVAPVTAPAVDEKMKYGFPTPFIDLPDSLKEPHKLAAISNYFANTSKAVFMSQPNTPPYDPPFQEEDLTEEQEAKNNAYEKEWRAKVAEVKTRQLTNGYYRAAALAREEARQAREQLPEILGESGYRDFKQWQVADRTAAILSPKLSREETYTAAVEIARMWADGFTPEKIFESFKSIEALNDDPEMKSQLFAGLLRR